MMKESIVQEANEMLGPNEIEIDVSYVVVGSLVAPSDLVLGGLLFVGLIVASGLDVLRGYVFAEYGVSVPRYGVTVAMIAAVIGPMVLLNGFHRSARVKYTGDVESVIWNGDQVSLLELAPGEIPASVIFEQLLTEGRIRRSADFGQPPATTGPTTETLVGLRRALKQHQNVPEVVGGVTIHRDADVAGTLARPDSSKGLGRGGLSPTEDERGETEE